MIGVGEYVRTKNGYIAKVTEKTDHYYWFDNYIYKESGIPHQGFRIENYKRMNIVKHSKDILDLIELGDIVKGIDGNKFQVCAIGKDVIYINNMEEFITIDCIKSIVTKEQFKNIQYTVEE